MSKFDNSILLSCTDPSKFTIIDQDFDGACFYNSISTYLINDYLTYSNSSVLYNLKNRSDKDELVNIIKISTNEVVSDNELEIFF